VNDKQILITGATNGIGLAAAEALAALGANLAIVGRSKTRTRIASARIRTAAGRGATVQGAACGGDMGSRWLITRWGLLQKSRKSDCAASPAPCR
jgi:NAD(P)-dependent dehydrogenase (short-subunit alcohol dehydrogenase family)